MTSMKEDAASSYDMFNCGTGTGDSSHFYQEIPVYDENDSVWSEEFKNEGSLSTSGVELYLHKDILSTKTTYLRKAIQCLVHISQIRLQNYWRYLNSISIAFIWGVLVGVALATFVFQYELLYSNSGIFLTLKNHASTRMVESRNSQMKNKWNAILQATKSNPDSKISSDIHKSAYVAGRGNLIIKQDHFRSKTRIYVGVITARKYLASRAAAVNDTWGRQVDGLEFFTQSGSREEFHLPVVNLANASDSEYPPQRKAFEMLKHMCAHHVDDYEWFVRADDDVYIRAGLLKKFLSTIDSDLPIYMGQPGHGVPGVRDRLGLKGHNFCMGGPGVIFNRKTLKALCPHLDDCIKEVVSKEEDVEIGRCVTNHVHIECTHAWETLKLFYHAYQEEYIEEKPFLGHLAENDHISNALTLHHLKLSRIMYNVHRHYTSSKMNETAQKILELRRNLKWANSRLPLGEKFHLPSARAPPPLHKPMTSSDVRPWQAFNTESLYSLSPAHVVDDITNDVFADLKQGQKFTYSHVSGGYSRSSFDRGTDYFVDVCFNNKERNNSNHHVRVHLMRPGGELRVASTKLLTLKDTRKKFVIILATFSNKTTQFEFFMRKVYEPEILVRGRSFHPYLVVVTIGNSTKRQNVNSPSVDEVLAWYRTRYIDANLISLPEFDDKVPVKPLTLESGYARGISYARQLLSDSEALVLLTSADVMLISRSLDVCRLRASLADPAKAFSSYTSYMDNKAEKKNDPQLFRPQLYQPVPFLLYPDLQSSMSVDKFHSKTVEHLSSSYIDSKHGFWDISSHENQQVQPLTPLCGSISDLHKVARSARESLGNATFHQALYKLVYAGNLSLFRTADSCFVADLNR